MRRLPFVLLVDEGSASATEVVAGIMQRDGVPVVGERTTGKWVSQERVAKEKHTLWITSAELFLGEKREKLNKRGIVPNHVASDDPTTIEDEAFRRAVEVLKESF